MRFTIRNHKIKPNPSWIHKKLKNKIKQNYLYNTNLFYVIQSSLWPVMLDFSSFTENIIIFNQGSRHFNSSETISNPTAATTDFTFILKMN